MHKYIYNYQVRFFDGSESRGSVLAASINSAFYRIKKNLAETSISQGVAIIKLVDEIGNTIKKSSYNGESKSYAADYESKRRSLAKPVPLGVCAPRITRISSLAAGSPLYAVWIKQLMQHPRGLCRFSREDFEPLDLHPRVFRNLYDTISCASAYLEALNSAGLAPTKQHFAAAASHWIAFDKLLPLLQ